MTSTRTRAKKQVAHPDKGRAPTSPQGDKKSKGSPESEMGAEDESAADANRSRDKSSPGQSRR